MSAPFTRFGAFLGLPSGDVRVQISGKGRKNILAITASYMQAAAFSHPPVPIPPSNSFQGRLVIVEGQMDPLSSGVNYPIPPDFNVGCNSAAQPAPNSQLSGLKILFSALLSSVGPWPFFLPLAQLEGSPQTDEDSVVNIILCIGQDGAGGSYVPSLAVSGQTVFGGTLAAQQSFLGNTVP
jgi:hypothetical protein